MGIRPCGRVPGGAGDHKGLPYVLGPSGIPVGVAFMAARSVRSPGAGAGIPTAEGGYGYPPLRTCARRGGRPQGSPLRVGAARRSCRGGLYGRPFCPIPRGPERECPRQRADVGIRPCGRVPGGAGDHKGRPYAFGPPGVPVGGDALIAPPHRLAAEAGARP